MIESHSFWYKTDLSLAYSLYLKYCSSKGLFESGLNLVWIWLYLVLSSVDIDDTSCTQCKEYVALGRSLVDLSNSALDSSKVCKSIPLVSYYIFIVLELLVNFIHSKFFFFCENYNFKIKFVFLQCTSFSLIKDIKKNNNQTNLTNCLHFGVVFLPNAYYKKQTDFRTLGCIEIKKLEFVAKTQTLFWLWFNFSWEINVQLSLIFSEE